MGVQEQQHQRQDEGQQGRKDLQAVLFGGVGLPALVGFRVLYISDVGGRGVLRAAAGDDVQRQAVCMAQGHQDQAEQLPDPRESSLRA